MKKKNMARKAGESTGQKKTVESVMGEFKSGKLKTPDGKQVTDKNQAIAIALNMAGLSNKSLVKAELLLKLREVKKNLESKIRKELDDRQALRSEIVKFFKKNPNPDDTAFHTLAVKLQISPHELEEVAYSILSEFINGGRSKGEEKQVDLEELKLGIQIESEHTSTPEIREKIARDHLSEDPKYYSKLKEMESRKGA